jgi:nuclear transport factor 2 (NTF2) superfamily protein
VSPVHPQAPFTHESAIRRTRAIEDAWNARGPERAALCYAEDARWRERAEFLQGREAIVEFLQQKWAGELDFRVIYEMWSFGDDRIAARLAAEWRDSAGLWLRGFGLEAWRFDATGLIRSRHASINDLPIAPEGRKFLWPAPGARPLDHPGLAAFGL